MNSPAVLFIEYIEWKTLFKVFSSFFSSSYMAFLLPILFSFLSFILWFSIEAWSSGECRSTHRPLKSVRVIRSFISVTASREFQLRLCAATVVWECLLGCHGNLLHRWLHQDFFFFENIPLYSLESKEIIKPTRQEELHPLSIKCATTYLSKNACYILSIKQKRLQKELKKSNHFKCTLERKETKAIDLIWPIKNYRPRLNYSIR